MNPETTVIVALIAAVPTIVTVYLSNRSQKTRDASDAKRAETEKIAVKSAKRKADAEIATLVSNSATVMWRRTQVVMKEMANDLEAEREKRRSVEATVLQQAVRIATLEKSDRRKSSVIKEQATRIAVLEKSDRLKGVVIREQAGKISLLESENESLRQEKEGVGSAEAETGGQVRDSDE